MHANTLFRDFFQKEWLGRKHLKLLKEGKFDFDNIFDPEEQFYSLDELKNWIKKLLKSWMCNFFLCYIF